MEAGVTCREAVVRAGRVAPAWLRVAWSEAMGVYAPDARYEQNTLKGFVERLAELLARLCGVVVNRGLLSQKLLAVIISPWGIEDTGDGCRASKSITLFVENGLKIDLGFRLTTSYSGEPTRLEVVSESLGCRAAWGAR